MKKRLSILKSDIKSVWIGLLAFLLYFFLANYFLDRYCPSVLIFGIPCPACGMTRAFVLLLKGRIFDALFMHPLILVTVVLILTFILFRYILLIDTKSLQTLLLSVLIIAIVIYIVRMFLYFPSIPPMTYYRDNLLARLFAYNVKRK